MGVESLREAFSRAEQAHQRAATVHQWSATVWRSRGDEKRAAVELRLADVERERSTRLHDAARGTDGPAHPHA